MNEQIHEDFGPEDQNRVVEFMAKAGWTTGTNIVNADSDIHLRLDEKGSAKMLALSRVLKSIVPELFGQASKKHQGDEIQQFRIQAMAIALELFKSDFSARESNAFMGLIAGYGLKNPDSSTPILNETGNRAGQV